MFLLALASLCALFCVSASAQEPDYEHITSWKGPGPLDPSFHGPLAGADLADFDAGTLSTGQRDEAAYWLGERALRIARSKLSAKDRRLAKFLNNAAVFANEVGLTERSEELYREALAIAADDLSFTTLGNLASLRHDAGDYSAAVSFATRALELCLRACPRDERNETVVAYRVTLAEALAGLGRLDEAESQIAKALAIAPQPKYVAGTLWLVQRTLAQLRMLQQRPAEAIDLYLTSLKSSLGESRSTVATTDGLALAYLASGDPCRASEALAHSADVADRVMANDLRESYPSPGENRLIRSVREFESQIEVAVAIERMSSPSLSCDVRRAALDIVLRRRALSEQFLARFIAAVRQVATRDDEQLLRELVDTRMALSEAARRRLTFGGYERAIRDLDDSARGAESALIRKHKGELPALTTVRVADVQRQLGRDEAIVQIVQFTPFALSARSLKDLEGAREYRAYVLRNDGITAVSLGRSSDVDDLVARFRDTLAVPQRHEPRARVALAEEAGDVLWEPLLPALTNVSRLFVVPDATLSSIPFGVLSMRGQLARDRYLISYLGSLAEYRPPNQRTVNAETGFVFAAPDFDAGPGELQRRWSPLNFADREAADIAESHPRATIVRGQAATKSAVVATPLSGFVHIATHAFFDLRSTTALQALVEDTFKPMLVGGVALSGANRRTWDGADAYLSSAEFAALDLRQVAWVFISGCESGGGDTRAGDGVFGLRRGLAIAGAKVQILALWKIDDEATAAFVREFYDAVRTRPPAEALQEAQKKTRDVAKWRDPYYWSGFVLSGS